MFPQTCSDPYIREMITLSRETAHMTLARILLSVTESEEVLKVSDV
jgi:hypothetical protein